MKFSGQRLKHHREARHLLQHDLASKLRERGFGTTQVTISRWENGQAPRASVLLALAAELHVSVEELYGDDADEEAAQVDVVAVLIAQARLHADQAKVMADLAAQISEVAA